VIDHRLEISNAVKRHFSSYGPVNSQLHYYAPRTALIENIRQQLIGETSESGGRYITVWAPRQTGKTWVMQQVVQEIREDRRFDALITTMQSGKSMTTATSILDLLVTNLRNQLNIDFPPIDTWGSLRTLFTSQTLKRPLILILDEFDALPSEFIDAFVNEFRSIYSERQNEIDRQADEKTYWLHGLALIGVRSVLGVENVSGSPFNVQRSVRIPNLTNAEVAELFQSYQRESGQAIDADVVERICYEMQGQPGLTCWLGELLTETYNRTPDQPITMQEFDHAFLWAVKGLGNNNILNIVSKVKQEPYRQIALSLFKTDRPIEFSFDDPLHNYLYLNGVIDVESTPDNLYIKFSSPFVQKRLFFSFANEIFNRLGNLYQPFENLGQIISEDSLQVPALIRRYERYLGENRAWLFKDAPRRSTDLRIFEAVYHFNLYMYLVRFLENFQGQVTPEFPTGNGKIDLVIRYAGQIYGLEIKSFVNAYEYKRALDQAAEYAHKLHLSEIFVVFFVEAVDEENRRRFEKGHVDVDRGVSVQSIFVTVGNQESVNHGQSVGA
jgi:hypothetical protein